MAQKFSQDNTKTEIPVIPLRGIVAYPKLTLAFDAGRAGTLLALDKALKSNRQVLLLAQKDIDTEEPKAGDLYRVGTVADIIQVLEVKNDYYKILTEGVYRAKVERLTRRHKGYYTAQIMEYPRIPYHIASKQIDELQLEATHREIISLFETYAIETGLIPPDAISFAKTLKNYDQLIDLVSVHVNFKHENKQALLEEQDLGKRLEQIILYLSQELKLFQYGQEIDRKVKKAIDKQQRDYYLREQMRTIEDELSGARSELTEADRLRELFAESNIPEEYREKVEREIDRVARMPANFPEASVQINWLEMVLKLPFGKTDQEKLDLQLARKILDRDHYGLKDVKQRIIEYLAVRKLQIEQGIKSTKGPILCLVGPPGVGKTSIAKSIAEAVGRKYIRMSLGGIRDESEIRGHRRTYVGAMAGRIMQGISHINTDNPLFLLDEIDKLGNDFRGDPSSALLEVLDPEQNNNFRDHYVEIPYDLSNVLFITTANSIEGIPGPLFDRMELIRLSGYTEVEKLEIAKRHLLPKQIIANGLNAKQLSMTDGALTGLISWYTAEAGVRQLERELARVCRRVAIKIAEDEVSHYRVKQTDLEDLLGKRKYTYDMAEKEDLVGSATGLAWTYAGGDTLNIEVNILPGSGKLDLTGQLGNVMKESAKAALTYCRSRSEDLGMAEDFIKQHDIHIHVPAGAVPKDGPSAGITIATALASAISGKKVRHDLAMTGEISLRGRVLPIGGLKEKSVAAHRAKIKEILIPKENERDLDDIPESVTKNLKITSVQTMDEVLKIALI
ncbi:MAG: endopeptidase La [Clostridiaceae bacterium]|mgnify:FL=1|nr:endopeptidase La [Clostridiaceae bacterium]